MPAVADPVVLSGPTTHARWLLLMQIDVRLGMFWRPRLLRPVRARQQRLRLRTVCSVMFELVGLEGSEILDLVERRWTGITSWSKPAGSAGALKTRPRAIPMVLESALLLRRDNGQWRIVVRLNHQDVGQLIRGRGQGGGHCAASTRQDSSSPRILPVDAGSAVVERNAAPSRNAMAVVLQRLQEVLAEGLDDAERTALMSDLPLLDITSTSPTTCALAGRGLSAATSLATRPCTSSASAAPRSRPAHWRRTGEIHSAAPPGIVHPAARLATVRHRNGSVEHADDVRDTHSERPGDRLRRLASLMQVPYLRRKTLICSPLYGHC